MSNQPKDGGPAFSTPSEIIYNPNQPAYRQIISAGGMSLRDYFAAAAMQGLLANIDTTSGKAQLAKSCYALADAMLAERAREKEEAQK